MLNLKALKAAAEKAFVGGTKEGDPDKAAWLEYTTLREFRREANPSTILSLIERCEELEGALEPNGDTKAAYMGEFSFNIETVGVDEDGEPVDCTRKVYVPWTTIKGIMAAIRARALSKADATS